ncbi:proline iminopeptidase [Suillus bovinus]|uniref:proline iminopeptidase n=1 Tax=Suillus bovinus TaxID=48563 RepID=UPI001B86E6E0|nr:proline iminopeptidase [Suillus bovinus]KAG2149115.1 proline iminopeptidase [Suillus bovinus]
MIRCYRRALYQRRFRVSGEIVARINLSPAFKLCSRPTTSSSTTLSKPTSMYPSIKPYESGFFPGANSDKHQLYYEVSGNKEGDPVIFLHGGPGGGTDPEDRQFFNPEKYKIVLFDQRGAGKSTPSAELENNTTWDLVKDIEVLRQKLGVTKWHVFGGSWAHPDRVKSLVLRGILTLRKSELRFFYQDGTSHLFPEQWEEYLAPIPEAERHDMMKAYHSRLNSSDANVSLAAAKAWAKWEMATSRLIVSADAVAQAEKDDFTNTSARIENHYFVNEGFMRDGQLLEKQEIDKIRHIPTIVVQGRYDVICTATTAWELKRAWPEITLHIIPDAGHSSHEPGIEKKLVEAADIMASKGL